MHTDINFVAFLDQRYGKDDFVLRVIVTDKTVAIAGHDFVLTINGTASFDNRDKNGDSVRNHLRKGYQSLVFIRKKNTTNEYRILNVGEVRADVLNFLHEIDPKRDVALIQAAKRHFEEDWSANYKFTISSNELQRLHPTTQKIEFSDWTLW